MQRYYKPFLQLYSKPSYYKKVRHPRCYKVHKDDTKKVIKKESLTIAYFKHFFYH